MEDFDPRYGVFHNYARDDYELPCRGCGKITVEDAVKCSACGTLAPGIYSECPKCYSTNYLWKHYGIHHSAALGGLLTMGPLGALFFGLKGRTEAECVCLDCGQGWMPFAFPGGIWTTTRKYKINKDMKSQNPPKIRATQSQADMERRRQAAQQRRQEELLEQQRQRIIQEQEKKRARAKMRAFFIVAVLLVCVWKLVSIKINENKDNWKLAYDRWLTPDGFYERQMFYELEDMNFDGIPELICFYLQEDGTPFLQICTYTEAGDSISILYSDYHVFPCEIGKRVKVFRDGNTEEFRVYNCHMKNGQIDYSEKTVRTRPETVGLIQYEEGDIIAGAYESKAADFSYLSPVPSSEVEYWDFDIDMAYQILSKKYTTEEVYDTIKAKISDTYSVGDRESLRFQAEILGYVGEIDYDRRLKDEEQHLNSFRWEAFECIDESTLIQEFGLTPMYIDEDFYVYDWNDKLKVKVVYYMNATLIDFYAYE